MKCPRSLSSVYTACSFFLFHFIILNYSFLSYSLIYIYLSTPTSPSFVFISFLSYSRFPPFSVTNFCTATVSTCIFFFYYCLIVSSWKTRTFFPCLLLSLPPLFFLLSLSFLFSSISLFLSLLFSSISLCLSVSLSLCVSLSFSLSLHVLSLSLSLLWSSFSFSLSSLFLLLSLSLHFFLSFCLSLSILSLFFSLSFLPLIALFSLLTFRRSSFPHFSSPPHPLSLSLSLSLSLAPLFTLFSL